MRLRHRSIGYSLPAVVPAVAGLEGQERRDELSKQRMEQLNQLVLAAKAIGTRERR